MQWLPKRCVFEAEILALALGLAGCAEIGEDATENLAYGRELSFVEGTVRDGATGRPLSGVIIYYHDWNSLDGVRFIQVGFTDRNGYYAFALGWGEPITSNFYSFEKARYDTKGFMIPEEATRVSSLEYHLDITLNHSWVVQ